MSSTLSFKGIVNKHNVYKGKYSLGEEAMEIINFKKKKMKLLTNKQQKSYENAKIC